MLTTLLVVVATIVAALIGAGATLWAVKAKAPLRRLDILIASPTRALSASGVLSKDLKIIYDEKEIAELWLAQVHLRNSGRDPIENLPVRWCVSADEEGIEVATHPFWEELEKGMTIDRVGTETRVSFNVPFLNPSEDLLVWVYFSGPIKSHQIECRQAGLIVRQGDDWPTQDRNWLAFFKQSAGGAVATAAVASLIAALLSSIGEQRVKSDERFRHQLEDLRRLSNNLPPLDKDGKPLSGEQAAQSTLPSVSAKQP